MPPQKPRPSDELVIAQTRIWLTQVVIGLELCPFAKPVYAKDLIRYRVSSAVSAEVLLEELMNELRRLSAAEPTQVDTTLLIHPHVLTDFLDYNDFLAVADLALEDLGLTGELQIASFHPDYQFAGNESEDLANCVTRSPYPMLHLLREASVERAVAMFPDASSIVDKNMRTMRALGLEGWQRLLATVHAPRS